MYYSAIDLLAILILIIENNATLLRRGNYMVQPAWRVYRRFLLSVLAYLVTDALWGILEFQKLSLALFIDTQIYFITMAVGIFFWTQYVVTYLDEKSGYASLLLYTGRAFSGGVLVLVALNFFIPVLFRVDERCVYQPTPTRDVLLILQIVLLLLISIYAFIAILKKKGAVGKRYRTIALFGLIMAAFLFIQLWFPYLPIYAVAYLLGTSLLHTFVVNDEKEEYRLELEEALVREKQHYEELKSARVLAYTDPLTRVKSKLAYAEQEKNRDAAIAAKTAAPFAIAVFDVNGLKAVNDKYGHEQGDQFLYNACQIICKHYQHSPVFRIGGDEFVALLERADYENRQELQTRFDRMMEPNGEDNQIVVAMGMAEYIPGQDRSLNDVFGRADRQMYERKRQLKG
ncbi:MAG: GGDEF domain-containing protein [Acutalibacteraceae bacterium]|jgi:diguanylate cyclase (GGDEF)-like protein